MAVWPGAHLGGQARPGSWLQIPAGGRNNKTLVTCGKDQFQARMNNNHLGHQCVVSFEKQGCKRIRTVFGSIGGIGFDCSKECEDSIHCELVGTVLCCGCVGRCIWQ